MTVRYLEDLKVGDRFESGLYAVTEEAIINFAREFDPQPFHLDLEAAKKSIFGGLVASGWHTAAITMRLLVTSNLNLAGGAIGLGVDEMRFPKPVRPGDTLRLELEIVEIRPSRSKPDRGTARIRYTTRNQNDEIVFTQTATVLVPKRAKKENIGDPTPKALASGQANAEKRLTQRERTARGR
jgi:acyl dehydratase